MSDVGVVDRAGRAAGSREPGGAPRGPRRRWRLLRGRSPWVQAPLILLSYPAIFVAVAAAFVILSLAVVSGPLFRSDAGNAALEDQLARVPGWLAGLTVSVPGPSTGTLDPTLGFPAPSAEDLFRSRDTGLRLAVGRLHAFGPPVVSVIADARVLRTAGPHPKSFVIRPVVRTNAFENVDVIQRVPGDGVWITDVVAKALGVRAGDRVLVARDTEFVPVLVVAVYRDLATPTVIPDFWKPLTVWIRPNNPDLPPFPPLTLMTLDTFRTFAAGIDDRPTFRWEFPLLRKQLTSEQGGALAANLTRMGFELRRLDSPLAAPYTVPEFETLFPSSYDQASQVAGILESPIDVLSLAASLVALALVGAVGVYWIQRRRVELRELGARGTGVVPAGSRSLLEALPAAAGGAAAGWFLAEPLIRRLGPTNLISPGVRTDALRSMVRTDAVAVVVLALVVGGGAGLAARARSGRATGILSRVPWEIVPLALAGAALYEVFARQSSIVTTAGGGTKVDRLLLLFPLLFLVGGSALVVRILRIGLARVRSVGGRRPTPLFVAFRRVANASGVAAVLVAAVAVATGTLTYAASLQRSLDSARVAKARTFLGSDHLLDLGGGHPKLPADLGPTATLVGRSDGVYYPAYGQVQILEIDPATFARGAYWDPGFGNGRPLSQLLAALRRPQGTIVPAVALAPGGLPSDFGVLAGPINVEVKVVGTVRAMPGSTAPAAILVDRAVLEQVLAGARERAHPEDRLSIDIPRNLEVWVTGSPAAVRSRLAAAHIPVQQERTAAEIRSSSAFLALSWTFGFMKGVGTLIGLVAVVALLLYLQGRQRSREVSYALARRMGLRSSGHGAALLLELSALLLIAMAIGVGLAIVAAQLTFGRLDPLPKLAPRTLMQIPATALLLSAAALAAGAVVGSILAQWRANRTNVAEVIRVAV